ncbi:MAG: hypothetical protein ACKO5R_01605, partial [Planctomycetaceae bacterium]
MTPRRALALLIVSLAACCRAQGADWPNWRGPGLDGVAAGSGYPTAWSADRNVAWRVPLPGA